MNSSSASSRTTASARSEACLQQPIDYNLLAALQHGMRNVPAWRWAWNRLVMLALGAESLSDVLAFLVGIA
ncbi:hypothetical protein M8494_36765 [Serratia ureilytica]